MKPKPHVDGAPGLVWRPRANHWVATWVARPDLVERGFTPKTQRLWPPSGETDSEFTDAVAVYLRSECSRLQSEMRSWSRQGSTQPGVPMFDGTLASLTYAYLNDPDSPVHALRFQSRRTYGIFIRMINSQVGERSLDSIGGRDLRRWYEEWAKPAALGQPRRTARAHSMITMLRIVFGFGIAFEYDLTHCARIKTILSEMSFENARSRSQEIVAEQAVAIRAAAWAMGRPSIALGQALQFELLLRQKDVIGEWVPISEPGMSDITAGRFKWVCGLDWREISPNLILTHRLSKSIRGRNAMSDPTNGKVKTYDLKLYPMVMEELAKVPEHERTGPVIKDEGTGLPYRERAYPRLWRQAARMAGIPDTAQNRDSRAGGITEGIEASDGDMEAARNAAGHSQVATTRIYNRGADRQTAKMASLRAAKRTTNRVSNGSE